MNLCSFLAHRHWRLFLLCLGGLLPCGCLGPLAKKLADKETYPIIAQKQVEALGTTTTLSIEPTTDSLTQQVRERAGFSSDLLTTQGLLVSLGDALALSVANNQTYQRRKEDVYLSALALTDERHTFAPIFSGTLSAGAQREPVATTNDKGHPRWGVERFGQAQTSVGVSRLLATGARVTVGLTNNFLRFYSGSPRESATGQLGASVVQPLLQGAGTDVNLENLRQAERDVIYEVRDFDRYRKQFTIDRIEQYYRLLQAKEEIDIEYQSYERLVVARERAEALQEAERMAGFQVDQARQDEITARNRWIIARTTYLGDLDDFKVALGLPPELNIQPDVQDLRQLEKAGLVQLSDDLKAAEQQAIGHRLDLKNAQDQKDDAQRRIKVAENSLLPVVDARVDADVQTGPGRQPLDMDARSRRYGAGLEVELPLDRKGERNDYRRALIDLERQKRQFELLRNQIVAQVRQAYQDVVEAQKTYELQLEGLRLAQRRVDNVAMLMDAGREQINIRDQLEAERSLRDAQNALTQVLVTYTIARLNYYNAIEAMEIDERGSIHETP